MPFTADAHCRCKVQNYPLLLCHFITDQSCLKCVAAEQVSHAPASLLCWHSAMLCSESDQMLVLAEN